MHEYAVFMTRLLRSVQTVECPTTAARIVFKLMELTWTERSIVKHNRPHYIVASVEEFVLRVHSGCPIMDHVWATVNSDKIKIKAIPVAQTPFRQPIEDEKLTRTIAKMALQTMLEEPRQTNATMLMTQQFAQRCLTRAIDL